ncbi:hypothetical protein [Granulosicoccus antarcticus]|uniref:Uncharacterized protein n=1 Tax=Granulosicoccus antarcticus IMCC3135 TaxID=1192854 RepID=A0A2Z2NY17_9GAMM|nr:hypothetical protein [Granulosicoccus antarcticus]ASJ72647.1 hypothetical protein IMCC3135_12795 [Granulosicoccus antarcticus IMCC3135]
MFFHQKPEKVKRDNCKCCDILTIETADSYERTMNSDKVKGMRNFVLLATILIAMSGCSTTAWDPYYKELKPTYEKTYKLSSPLIVASQDQRPYVLSGNKTELFYGLTRSLFGIPYSQSGPVSASNDIIEYVSLLIEDESSIFGIKRKSIGIDEDGLSVALDESTRSPVLFIQFYEWKTDTPAVGTGLLHYDLRAKVIDQAGQIVAQEDVKGTNSIINPDPGSGAKRKTGRWYQKAKGDALGKILLNPAIFNAINLLSSEQLETNTPA